VFAECLYFTGPLELTRRTKALVWDDEVELTEEIQEAPGSSNPHQYSPQLSVNSVPLPRRTRSQSSVSDFPPPIRRTSTEASRPVPFAAKFQRVHPGTTGVTVLEHLERLDAVEASLKRLGGSGDDVIEEEEEGEWAGEEEVDVGESLVGSGAAMGVASSSNLKRDDENAPPASPFSPPGSPLRAVPEVPTLADSMTEEDLIAMSKSMSHAEVSSSSSQFKWASNARREPTHDWMRGDEGAPVKKMIVEVSAHLCFRYACSCSAHGWVAVGNDNETTTVFLLVNDTILLYIYTWLVSF
jgi:phosphatidylinositol 4-kinase type 2